MIRRLSLPMESVLFFERTKRLPELILNTERLPCDAPILNAPLISNSLPLLPLPTNTSISCLLSAGTLLCPTNPAGLPIDKDTPLATSNCLI